MRLPPLGFVLPVLSAIGMAMILMPTSSLPAFQPPALASPSGRALDAKSLPFLTDAPEVRAAFADRPLLAEDRLPPQTADPAQDRAAEISPSDSGSETARTPQLEVAGSLTVNGEARVLLRDPATGSETWASKGDRFGAWTLVEITQMAAILESAGAQVTIQLFQERLP